MALAADPLHRDDWLLENTMCGGDLGMNYLGTQGDIRDAHKDMALAATGALLAMLLTALLNILMKRDFAREIETGTAHG